MSIEVQSHDLLVLEYGGTGRSGKGTIVGDLQRTYADIGIATEETGADYRATTLSLLLDNTLEEGMSPDDIAHGIESVSTEDLTERVAARNSLVEEVGLKRLYKPDVTDLVGHVSPLPRIRKAVKAGFTKRIEAVRDSGDFQILLVDGRNLAPVVETISGTTLLMRTFVSCYSIEAARRECIRQGIQPRTPEWSMVSEEEYRRTENRNKLDANRSVDPVIPDENAVDYWMDNEVMLCSTIMDAFYNGKLSKVKDLEHAKLDWLMEKTDHEKQTRYGVGSIACRDQRQINFDTSYFYGYYKDPLNAMLDASRMMFEEAIGQKPWATYFAQKLLEARSTATTSL